jgi:cystathionine beta-synthase
MFTCVVEESVEQGNRTIEITPDRIRDSGVRERPLQRGRAQSERSLTEALNQRIGNTPLVRLPPSALGCNPMVSVFAKLEYFNPSGSIKDRLVSHWLTKKQVPDNVNIVLASSGNTAASLSMLGHSRSRKVHIFTPTSTSLRKLEICKAYGAKIHLCESDYEQAATDFACANGFALFDQYNDLLNVDAYEMGLGPEILSEVPEIDYFVAAASTGGTISGVGKFLHQAKPGVGVVLADPVGSILDRYIKSGQVDTGCFTAHGVEGAGKGKITDCFVREHIDASIAITEADAFSMSHRLSKEFSVAAGLSSGLIAAACRELANTCTKPTSIVCVFPDSSTRYIDRVGL